jgi:hypothetical protein
VKALDEGKLGDGHTPSSAGTGGLAGQGESVKLSVVDMFAVTTAVCVCVV